MRYEVIWDSNLKNKDRGTHRYVWPLESDNCDELLAMFNESLEIEMSETDRDLWNIKNQSRGTISAKYGLDSRIMHNSIGSESIKMLRLLRKLESRYFSSKFEVRLRNYRLNLRFVPGNYIHN